jgi:hypothetical protein
MIFRKPYRNGLAVIPRLLLASMILGLILACTQNVILTKSEPRVKSMATEAYQIDFQPVGEQEGLFTGFMLSMRNTSTVAITVDWNKSRYMYNGKGQGGFVFKGVKAENVNNIPADVIPPGGSLSRELWPLKLVAIAPIRSSSVAHGERGFSPGAIPVGENGILLVMSVGEKITRQSVAVTISNDSR